MNKKYNVHIMFDNNIEIEVQVGHEEIYDITHNEIWSWDHYQIGNYFITVSKIVYITYWEIENS